MKEGIPMTPAGAALMLLQPPFIYIILAILLCCCIGFLLKTFWDTLQPYVYAVLDCFACIVRTIVTTAKACWWLTKRVSYPIKETVFKCIDRVDNYLHPYKKRRPRADVPSFQY